MRSEALGAAEPIGRTRDARGRCSLAKAETEGPIDFLDRQLRYNGRELSVSYGRGPIEAKTVSLLLVTGSSETKSTVINFDTSCPENTTDRSRSRLGPYQDFEANQRAFPPAG